MKIIELKKMPNQKIMFDNGSDRWELSIKTAIHSIFVDVMLNNEVVCLGQRIVCNVPFIYDTVAKQQGNFVITSDSELSWQKFGDSQQLIFFPYDIERKPYNLLTEYQKGRVSGRQSNS